LNGVSTQQIFNEGTPTEYTQIIGYGENLDDARATVVASQKSWARQYKVLDGSGVAGDLFAVASYTSNTFLNIQLNGVSTPQVFNEGTPQEYTEIIGYGENLDAAKLQTVTAQKSWARQYKVSSGAGAAGDLFAVASYTDHTFAHIKLNGVSTQQIFNEGTPTE